jgi:hypothetical protein
MLTGYGLGQVFRWIGREWKPQPESRWQLGTGEQQTDVAHETPKAERWKAPQIEMELLNGKGLVRLVIEDGEDTHLGWEDLTRCDVGAETVGVPAQH